MKFDLCFSLVLFTLSIHRNDAFFTCITETIFSGKLGTKNLYQFKNMIELVTGVDGACEYFNNYGCWCGPGGSGRAVDETDACCQLHDRCYDEAVGFQCSPKVFNIYKYTATRGSAICNDKQDSCNRRICECDKAAAECFFRSQGSYNKVNKQSSVRKECRLGYETGYHTSGSQCITNNHSSNCCKRCPSGHVCPCKGEVNPILCQPGTAAGVDQVQCLKCRPGYYTNTSGYQCITNNQSRNCCKRCPNGHICPNSGTFTPIICPIGTAANIENNQCLKCSTGYYTSIAGFQCKINNHVENCCSYCGSNCGKHQLIKNI